MPQEDKGMTQVRSVLVRAGSEPCAVLGRLAAPWLRPYVAGSGALVTGARSTALVVRTRAGGTASASG